MQKHSGLTVVVHPILFAYLTKGFFSIRRKWRWKYKQKINVVVNNNYHLTEFHFFDKNEEEIKL
jgi:ribonuclease G